MFSKLKLMLMSPKNREKYLLEQERKERAEKREKGEVLEEEVKEIPKKVVKVVKKVRKVEKRDKPVVNEPEDNRPVISKKKKMSEKKLREADVFQEESLSKTEKVEESRAKLADLHNRLSKDSKGIDEGISGDVFDLGIDEDKDAGFDFGDGLAVSGEAVGDEEEKEEEDVGFDFGFDLEVSGVAVSGEDEEEEIEEVEDSFEDEREDIGDLLELGSEESSEGMSDYAEEMALKKLEEEKRAKVQQKMEEREKYMGIMIDLPPSSDIDKMIVMALEAGVPEWYLREEGLMKDDEGFDELEGVEEEVFVESEEEDTLGDVEDSLVVGDIGESLEDEGGFDPTKDIFEGVLEDDSSDDIGEDVVFEDESVDKVVDNEELASRLAKLKVVREVLKVEGDSVLVKEEKEDSQGNKKSKYSNYTLGDEDIKKVAVGASLEDSIEVGDVKEEEVLIGGEVYDVSTEEEERLYKELEKKEVWVISDKKEWLDHLSEELGDTRYRIYAVYDEKSFLLATRKSGNLVVITQDIADVIKSSIVGYLGYLESEKMKARLVSLKSSLVNAPVIEYVLDDITEEDLDNYFSDFGEDTGYGESMKPVSEIMRSISFDITDQLEGNYFDGAGYFEDGEDSVEVEVDSGKEEEDNVNLGYGGTVGDIDLGALLGNNNED